MNEGKLMLDNQQRQRHDVPDGQPYDGPWPRQTARQTRTCQRTMKPRDGELSASMDHENLC
jgi:hypothetical protein